MRTCSTTPAYLAAASEVGERARRSGDSAVLLRNSPTGFFYYSNHPSLSSTVVLRQLNYCPPTMLSFMFFYKGRTDREGKMRVLERDRLARE